MRVAALALMLPLLAATPVVAASSVQDASVTTGAGKAVEVGVHRGWRKDCSERKTTVTIVSQPSNGTITVKNVASTIPSQAAVGTVQANCAGKPVPGKQVVYTPKSGFRGKDTFVYAVAFGGASTVTRRVSVDVK